MTPEQRLVRLERRCRLLSGLLTATVVSVGCAILTGANGGGEAKKLQVTGLEVVDAAGNVRIRIGELHPGKPDIFGAVFRDAEGKSRATIHDLAQLNLSTGEGSARLSAGEAGANLQLGASGGRPRAMFYAQDELAGIQLRDTEGEIRVISETPRLKLPGKRVADPFAPED